MRNPLIKSIFVLGFNFLSISAFAYNIPSEDVQAAIDMFSTCGTEIACQNKKPIIVYGSFNFNIKNTKKQTVTYDINEYVCFGKPTSKLPCDSRRKIVTLLPNENFENSDRMSHTNSIDVDDYGYPSRPVVVGASFGYSINEKFLIDSQEATKLTAMQKELPILVKK